MVIRVDCRIAEYKRGVKSLEIDVYPIFRLYLNGSQNSIKRRLSLKTAALIIAEKTFRDEEYQIPKDILGKAGIKVVTASTTTNEAVGKLGLKVKPDILVSQIDVEKLDALIFIGGGGASQYFSDPLAHSLAIEAAKNGKIYGAICIAPTILANAGLLRGKKATVFPSQDGIEALKKGGAVYSGKEVEIDGKLITGCGPEAAKKFGEALVKMLLP